MDPRNRGGPNIAEAFGNRFRIMMKRSAFPYNI